MSSDAFATIAQLARALRAREVSAVELARLALDRLARLGPTYNALAALTPELALAQARRADRWFRQGRLTSILQGIPYGAKDLLATRGIPTRWGSPAHRRQVFAYDATVVRRLAEAGAVLAGKLAMVELAGGGGYAYPSASLHGPGLNPWNLRCWAGGSSSGSGSAVAAGLVPYALGSETWGSIVTPSAYCGITGLRPTWGLVSRFGAMELAWTMDKIGPMARTAEDCGWVLAAIAGPDPQDPTTAGRFFQFVPRVVRRPWRLGILPAEFTGAPALARAFDEAVRVLRRAGMRIAEARLPEHPYEQVARTLLNGEIAAAHQEFIASKRLEALVDREQKDGLRASLRLRAADQVRAEQARWRIRRDVLALFERFDALLSPSLMTEAVPLETNLKTTPRPRGNWSVLGALCGVPALSVPMGFGPQGLPLGLAVTGPLFGEATLLQIGMRFQRETDWHQKRPPAPPGTSR
ncbi:MAG: amidase [Armatimonadota bacterium]|nr:amidase [Armatimonadota bacterium]MDR7486834.1 amidase [Armatimonadota bacterium]MDR7532971.1 amidase [Armatimonadota bacterium]MDR7537554.1 amidase [Armatimonadota bacterium]